jgi:regulator of RNase E activity RraA
MANIGYRIYKNFSRPSQELLKQLDGIPIANLGDCMNRRAAISSAIQSVNGKRMIGTAYTVNSPAGDNLLFYYAIDNANPGDIIVIANDGFTERALCGEIMVSLAQKRGLAGFVVDGAIRDKAEIREMKFPVFAKASIPNGPYKNGPGEINVPVCIGGQVVFPGDILIGDVNGLVVIRPQEAAEIYKKAHAVMKKEAEMMDNITRIGRLNLTWMYEKLKQDDCEIIEEAKQ